MNFIYKLMANKHTSIAGLIYLACLGLKKIAPIWFPEHAAQCIQTAGEIENVAVGYGFLMAGDGGTTTPSSGQGNGTNLAQKVGLFLIGAFLGSALLTGCAAVAPGNDPLIVHTEQVQTDAKAGIDFLMHTENAQRSYWKTNQPGLYKFCEDLRQPTLAGTNVLPRASAMLWSLDKVKLDYKAGRASSNDLVAITATVSSVATEAADWSVKLKLLK